MLKRPELYELVSAAGRYTVGENSGCLPAPPRVPKVAILLCTYYGQHYLKDQLESFAAQTHSNWEVWVSDDGSKDETHAILASYRAKWGAGKLSVHRGPAVGFVANFLSLTCRPGIQADYYAFSDQDDVWELDKLKRAVMWLETVPPGTPAVYCTRTRLVDAHDQEIGMSPLFTKPPSFANALMQNIGGGNTMVFNNAARDLLRMAGDDVQVITHDWWAYLVVVACGGMVRYDPLPSLRYRQHGANLVGSNQDWAARLCRVKMLWKGRFRELNEQHIAALQRVRSRMTEESKTTLELFSEARTRSLIPRAIGFLRAGIHRQTLSGNLGLIAATLFKKM